jgi:Zn-dependent membrane protease YugP
MARKTLPVSKIKFTRQGVKITQRIYQGVSAAGAASNVAEVGHANQDQAARANVHALSIAVRDNLHAALGQARLRDSSLVK